MREIVEKVSKWGADRDINDAKRQIVKLREEIEELEEGLEDLISQDKELSYQRARALLGVADAIGDSQVVLIQICRLVNLSFDGCLGAAYIQIKDRTGKTVDGIFIKDE